ncbi:MAG: hypothetical protein ABL930_12410 [Pseudobdellovibrio sp.]
MKWISTTTIVLVLVIFCSYEEVSAKTTKVRSIQEVNFSEMNLKGTIRNPDGAYLVQKKGLKFLPIYNLQKDLDQKIREAALFVD